MTRVLPLFREFVDFVVVVVFVAPDFTADV
jgi:hypothetical protein